MDKSISIKVVSFNSLSILYLEFFFALITYSIISIPSTIVKTISIILLTFFVVKTNSTFDNFPLIFVDKEAVCVTE